MYIHTYIYIYIYIHTQKHTYIHTYCEWGYTHSTISIPKYIVV